MRDLVYYIATSIDGFIADPQGDFSVFPQQPETLAALFGRYPETCPAPLRDALGVTGEPQRFDTVIMGRRTYEPALTAGWVSGAYPHLEQVVVSHHKLPDTAGVAVMSGDVAGHVATLKENPGRDIWLCGGGDLAAQLIDQIDEIQLKINPIVLGAGIPVLPTRNGPRDLQLTALEQLPGGVTLVTYRRR